MADTKTEPNIPVDRDSADNVVCVLTDPFEVGDCQMNAGAQVNLILEKRVFLASAQAACRANGMFINHPYRCFWVHY